ncbi:hypothetical protein [Methylosinus sp. RM1]|uniref:hypothetical protein n=1 Tax=Methylosinus sp. RM1 TaxID=2583817 RepID=UPI00140CA7D7|nr:hypothetical protein [Methylosinus sp. RM1]
MPSARPTLSGYLIDPAAATIRAVELDPTYFHRTLRRLIRCDHMERVDLDEAHVAYCDSRRTTEPVTGFWTFPAHGSRPPIAGRAVIVGNDSASMPGLPLQFFAATITAYRPVIIPFPTPSLSRGWPNSTSRSSTAPFGDRFELTASNWKSSAIVC